MLKNLIVFIFVTFFVVPAVSLPAEIDEFAVYENEISKSFYRGDYYKLYDNIERLLLRFPDKPESYIYYSDLFRLKGVYGCERARDSISRVIEIIKSKKGFGKRNQCILSLKLELERLQYQFERKKAERLSGELHPIRDWILMGPYFRYGKADLDYPFLPEITTRLDNRNLNRKRIVLKNTKGELDFREYMSPDYEIAYAVTTIKTDKPVKLRIYSSSSYKLFINGRKILSNERVRVFRRYRVAKIWGTEFITIMLKLSKGKSWSFRIIVTDENDIVLKPVIKLNKMVFSDFKFFEELDYPFAQFVERSRKDPSKGYFLLGSYFDELDSKESISYYRRSVDYRYDPVKQFFLASGMINYSNGDSGSELYMEGWRILEQLAGNNIDFIPVQYMRFKKLIRRKSYHKAYFEGRNLIRRSRFYFPLRVGFADLLQSLGYEKEFEEEIRDFIKAFPNSIIPLRRLAYYYRERNIEKSIILYDRITKRVYDKRSIFALIEIFRRQGAYDNALRLIKRFDFDGDFKKQLIEILIEKGEYKRAKNIIFGELVKSDNPYYYFKLGTMSYKRNLDPSMYWGKLLSIKPSYFNIGDFLDYTETGRITQPLLKYCNYSVEERIIDYLLRNSRGDGEDVLLRSRIYLLNNDGSSRAFFEDVVHLRDQQSIDKWGEYRVPSRGRIYPVRVRVYYKDGGFSDSYRIEKVNGNYYINISSLKEGAIVHIAYYLDFPITDPQMTNFFSTPFMIVQDFDEPVSYFLLRVIAPKDMVVDFCFNREIKVERDYSGDRIIYTAEIEGLNAIQSEEYCGNRLNHLPFFAFSTMGDLKDFVTWYNGLLRGVFEIDRSRVKRFEGGDVRDILVKVYDFVSREIDLLNNVLYYPEKSRNTLFKKSGSVEDKVILAKSILDSIGIKSYIAFTREDDFPDVGSFISIGLFSRILLYIPLDKENEIWMDFSNQFYRCGIVDERVISTNAVIIIRNDYEVKRIDDDSYNGKTGIYAINIDNLGNAQIDIRLKFHGRYGRIRRLFRNKIYIEDEINRYIGRIIPSISIDRFNIENLDNHEEDFRIRVKGENYSHVTIGGNRLIFQPIINRSEVSKYIRYYKRDLPLIIKSPIYEVERYVYKLPSGFVGSEFNRSDKIKSKYGHAIIKIKKIKGSRELIIQKTIRIEKGIVNPNEYHTFLNFCMKIKGMENRNVVIRN